MIDIEDRDFAYFYRDIREETEKYDGKTVHFKGIVALDRKMKEGTFGVGRLIMTCCAADIAYNGLVCIGDPDFEVRQNEWLTVTARVDIEYHRLYGTKGPVLKIFSAEHAAPLPEEEEVAVFY